MIVVPGGSTIIVAKNTIEVFLKNTNQLTDATGFF